MLEEGKSKAAEVLQWHVAENNLIFHCHAGRSRPGYTLHCIDVKADKTFSDVGEF